MMRFLILGFGLLLFNSCEKTDPLVVPDIPELIGYWQFVDYGENNDLFYISVVSDKGLEIHEKSMMLHFQTDGTYRQYFWSWCGTPPSPPSGWRSGAWEQLSTDPLRIRLTQDNTGYTQIYEIVQLDGEGLVLRAEPN